MSPKRKKDPGKSRQNSEGAGVFTDRSGKVHGKAKLKGAPDEEKPAGFARVVLGPIVKPVGARSAPNKVRGVPSSGRVDRKGKFRGGSGGGAPKKARGRPQAPEFGAGYAGKGKRKQKRGDRDSTPTRKPSAGGGAGKIVRGQAPGRAATKRGGRPPDASRGAPGQKLKAMIDKNARGFGFLLFENRKIEDAFVPPRQAQQFFHGDRVEVTLDDRGQIDNVRLLEHRFRELIGVWAPHPNGDTRGGWIVYERKRSREEVYSPKPPPVGTKAGDWVRASLTFHDSGAHSVTGEIVESYGKVLPASADIKMVAAEYNLVEENSSAAIEEAERTGTAVSEADIHGPGREDLRQTPFITIDGETARDFDDAVFVEREGDAYILWVAIADVSHYVKPGTSLDQDARSRGTSVYFPERAFHMLPRALSENLCSLKPNVPRLTLVARMRIDRHGKRLETRVMEAVIQSKRRATYSEIQDEWEKHGKTPGWEFTAHFELYKILRKARSDRGSIDFELPEAELNVQPDGEVISITMRGRKDSHRLIEEFMISANEGVTEWMLERKLPFVYRTHDVPTAEALQKFQTLAATVGVNVVLDGSESSPKVLADLVKSLEDHPAAALLNTALLRSMKQAVYTATHGIHYGLASEGYTHFTSPIRRYPDLVVHRLLRNVVRAERGKGDKLGGLKRETLEKELAEICEHCSYRERLASEAERESIKLKQVRLMMKHLGDEFDGKINGLVESGMFVRTNDPFTEGLVLKESMTDDFYQFNEDRMIMYGARKRRTFKIGDPVRVRVLKADLERRMVDFGLV